MFAPRRNLHSFSIGIWNANGLRAKSAEFKDFIERNNLDVILVTETHFSQGNCVRVANYELFNVDRPLVGIQLSGGTAIYVKRGFNATLAKVPDLKFIEVCPIILDFPFITNLLVAASYVPCDRRRRNLLRQDLTSLTKKFQNFILVGD